VLSKAPHTLNESVWLNTDIGATKGWLGRASQQSQVCREISVVIISAELTSASQVMEVTELEMTEGMELTATNQKRNSRSGFKGYPVSWWSPLINPDSRIQLNAAVRPDTNGLRRNSI
jgi:hypothetical protein